MRNHWQVACGIALVLAGGWIGASDAAACDRPYVQPVYPSVTVWDRGTVWSLEAAWRANFEIGTPDPGFVWLWTTQPVHFGFRCDAFA